jgi:hypothetical protein
MRDAGVDEARPGAQTALDDEFPTGEAPTSHIEDCHVSWNGAEPAATRVGTRCRGGWSAMEPRCGSGSRAP